MKRTSSLSKKRLEAVRAAFKRNSNLIVILEDILESLKAEQKELNKKSLELLNKIERE